MRCFNFISKIASFNTEVACFIPKHSQENSFHPFVPTKPISSLMYLRLWSPDCTSPFYVHFHTDASPETGTPATPAQVSRGEHEKPLTSADNAAKVVFVAQSIQIGRQKVFGGCNLLAMSADVQEILGLIL